MSTQPAHAPTASTVNPFAEELRVRERVFRLHSKGWLPCLIAAVLDVPVQCVVSRLRAHGVEPRR